MTGILSNYSRSDIEKMFDKKSKKNPVVTIDGIDYTIGIGINSSDFADVIRHDEMENDINKICFNPSLTNYYVITPDYYKSIANWKYFDWIGECKSKMYGQSGWKKFGFVNKNSGLEKYDF